jgi:hypothetical protein
MKLLSSSYALVGHPVDIIIIIIIIYIDIRNSKEFRKAYFPIVHTPVV